ncbi:Zinc resistance conferring protein [Elasticomyces elasticus]|nr:Zinc resistance conferring protein [Elasticomyces elasticus]
MGLSKSTRILILLGIDTAFFLLELIVGYAVHSLALVADAFHMLNDVLSLCVGLWAVKVAQQKTSSKYTYGWQRAETLGALVNGVFLVALCLSIFLEAIQRFVEPQEVSNPKLVLIVGCFGLASNILGLFLFHEHGHSHGEGGHSHGHGDEISSAEEGRVTTHSHGPVAEDVEAADEGGNVADVLPQSRIATWPKSKPKTVDFAPSEGSGTTAVDGSSQITHIKSNTGSRKSKRRHSRSRSRGYSGFEEIHVNPASFRKSIIEAGRLDDIDSGEGTDTDVENAIAEDDGPATHESSPLRMNGAPNYGSTFPAKRKSIDHKAHIHAQPKDAGKKGGHSHGDLNMRGVFLHVMGDALGNIGVIASALIIWLAHFSWRFYFDPAISLVITVIILCSAIPLCKAASRILLQAVPAGISVDDIKDDIQTLPGIISCHHLHVWQLSDTKMVASLHVQVEFDFKGEGSARYMELARAIRKCLHEHGIHSSTIQPEFCLDPDHDHAASDEEGRSNDNAHSPKTVSKQASKAGSLRDEPDTCLLECDDECGGGKSCCAPAAKKAGAEEEHGDHGGHGEHDGHGGHGAHGAHDGHGHQH